jgi:hypothetical protein
VNDGGQQPSSAAPATTMRIMITLR